MTLAFLVVLILAGLWIFKQGKQVSYYKKAFEDQLEWRKAQTSHISFIEAENRRYADQVKNFETALASKSFSEPWLLREQDTPSTDTLPHPKGTKIPKD
jgi:hypothetical protein